MLSTRIGGRSLARLAPAHRLALSPQFTIRHDLLNMGAPPSRSPTLSALTPLRAFSSSPLAFAPPTPIEAAPPSAQPHPSPHPRRLSPGSRRQLVALRAELARLQRLIATRPPIPPYLRRLLVLLALTATALLTYELSQPVRRAVLAVTRSMRIGVAVALCIVDYKLLFRKEWPDTDAGRAQRHLDYEETHRKSGERMADALRKNGGIYLKFGQHLSAMQLIPVPWQVAMTPLQDQCIPSSILEVEAMFEADVGAPLSTLYDHFDPEPIGVASLAQVHRATERATGRKVALKVMHPGLEEFCEVDMQTTQSMVKLVRRFFPTFEFGWLATEMEINLPLEMDFRHEAANALRCAKDFADLPGSALVVPEVLLARKRVMVMEFIEGARVDNFAYLEKHEIDRTQLAKQIGHIFARQMYEKGFFHGDPHSGNLLIRAAPPTSTSAFNFEVVLLDHGLYASMNDDLRVAYAHLWLALLSPSSPKVERERRHWAEKAAGIGADLYPHFHAAVTGRLAAAADAGDMLEMGHQTKAELNAMRHAVVMKEGGIDTLLELLRKVPRRLLLVLKVNDLTRALEAALMPEHAPQTPFLILAQHCNLAIHQAVREQLHSRGWGIGSLGRLWARGREWWRFVKWRYTLWTVEFVGEMKRGRLTWPEVA